MICPACDKETSDQRMTCVHCGALVNKECPRCAEIVKLKANFCRFCGYEFMTQQAPPAEQPVEQKTPEPPKIEPQIVVKAAQPASEPIRPVEVPPQPVMEQSSLAAVPAQPVPEQPRSVTAPPQPVPEPPSPVVIPTQPAPDSPRPHVVYPQPVMQPVQPGPAPATARSEPAVGFSSMRWGGWIVTNVLAGVVAFVIGGIAGTKVMSSYYFQVLRGVIPLVPWLHYLLGGIVAGLIVGVIFGAAQAFFFRKWINPKRWFTATLAGTLISHALAALLFEPILFNRLPFDMPGNLNSAISWVGLPLLIGLTIGLVQVFIMQPRGRRAAWWILASMLAWSLDMALAQILKLFTISFMGGLFLPLTWSANSPELYFAFAGILRGLLIGLLTGLVLYLERERERKKERLRWVFAACLVPIVFIFTFGSWDLHIGAVPTAAPMVTTEPALPAATVEVAIPSDNGNSSSQPDSSQGDVQPAAPGSSSPANPQPPASSGDIAILPFNYQVEDTGDGWKVGTLDLAFVNTSEQLIPSQTIGFYLLDIKVETQEGKTYPASLFITPEGPGGYSYGQGINPIVIGRAQKSWNGNSYEVNPNGLTLPPQLPVSMVLAKFYDTISNDPTIYYTLDRERYHYFVQFQFAAAATPTRLILPAENHEYQIDLRSSATNSPELIPGDIAQGASLAELSQEIRQINPNLQIDFGQCSQDNENYPHDYYLPFTLTNLNNLDQSSIDNSYGFWYSNGVYLTSIVSEGGSFLRAGPGQTVEGKLKILNWGVPTLLVLYENDGVKMYELRCGG